MIILALAMMSLGHYNQAVSVEKSHSYQSSFTIEEIFAQSLLGAIDSIKHSDGSKRLKDRLIEKIKEMDIKNTIPIYYEIKNSLESANLYIEINRDSIEYYYTMSYKGYTVWRYTHWKPGEIILVTEIWGSMSSDVTTKYPARVVTNLKHIRLVVSSIENKNGTLITLKAKVNLNQSIESIYKSCLKRPRLKRCIERIVRKAVYKRGPLQAKSEATLIARKRLSGVLTMVIKKGIDLAAGGRKKYFYQNYIEKGLKYFDYE